ncbi:hypothetical protein [Spiroplasma endosymbiont of Danaus chrysippus]|uniref:hypothetical protein n=1 Tax=Spiroplasma endosymbiont of Danaus chrysippus TaxID=2691041 RepID=UPI0013C9EF91|nr:hypothetical protein [Spiroplasma endosymbiont of Danaus chrysippus]CAB1053881.1 hypothetical protein [Spiroplasma endosymbiont of Danaus chrysippus]
MINEKTIKEKTIYSCNSIEFDKLPKKLDSNEKKWIVINSHLIVNPSKNIEVHLDNRFKTIKKW